MLIDAKYDHVNRCKRNKKNPSPLDFFMKKVLRKLKLEGNFLTMIENIYKNPSANIYLMVRNWLLFP